jgi:hypothetical protein
VVGVESCGREVKEGRRVSCVSDAYLFSFPSVFLLASPSLRSCSLPIHIIPTAVPYSRLSLPPSLSSSRRAILISFSNLRRLLSSSGATWSAGRPSIVPWRQLPRRARTTLPVNPHIHPRCRTRSCHAVALGLSGAWLGEYSAPLPVHVRPHHAALSLPTLLSPRVHRPNILLPNVFLARRCCNRCD